MESHWIRQLCKWFATIVGVLFLLALLTPLGEVLLSIALHLLLGGIAHLWASAPHLIPGPAVVIGFLVLLALSVCALQALMDKFGKARHGPEFRWRPRWTLAMVGLLLAALGTACTTIGLAHHAAWLGREDVVHDDTQNGIVRSVRNCRQLMMELKLHAMAHQGQYPATLEALVGENLTQEHFDRINYVDLRDGMRLPWIFLPGVADDDTGSIPVVVSPTAVSRSSYVVGLNDGSATIVKREVYEEMMTRYHEYIQGAPAK
jgi:hypothetical protein